MQRQALDLEVQNLDRAGQQRPGVDADNESLQLEDVLGCTPLGVLQSHAFGHEINRPADRRLETPGDGKLTAGGIADVVFKVAFKTTQVYRQQQDNRCPDQDDDESNSDQNPPRPADVDRHRNTL